MANKSEKGLGVILTSLETRIDGLERAIKLLLTLVKYDLSKLPSHLKPVFSSTTGIGSSDRLNQNIGKREVKELVPVIKSAFSLATTSATTESTQPEHPSEFDGMHFENDWSPHPDSPDPAADPDIEYTPGPVQTTDVKDKNLINKILLKTPPPSSEEPAGTTIDTESALDNADKTEVSKDVKVTIKRERKRLVVRSKSPEDNNPTGETPTNTTSIVPKRCPRKPQINPEDQPLKKTKPRYEYKGLGKTCEICKIDFKNFSASVRHKQKFHKKSGWRECPYCNKIIYNNSKYQLHLRRHTGQKPYMCSQCGATFTSTMGLKGHELVHVKVKQHICKYCGSAHKTAAYLKKHEECHEGIHDEAMKECPICKRKFPDDRMKKHIREVHDQLRRFKCPKCDFKFKRGCHLKRHLLAHDNPNRRVKGYHIYRPEKVVAIQRKTSIIRLNENKVDKNVVELKSESCELPIIAEESVSDTNN